MQKYSSQYSKHEIVKTNMIISWGKTCIMNEWTHDDGNDIDFYYCVMHAIVCPVHIGL